MNILLIRTPSVTIRRRRISSLPRAKHQILNTQVHITHALEDGAELECRGNNILRIEQITHLHYITEEPRSQDGDPETFAGTRALVGEDLWNGKESFDGESGDAEEVGVGLCLGDEGEKDVDDEKGAGEVAQECPVPDHNHVSIQPFAHFVGK